MVEAYRYYFRRMTLYEATDSGGALREVRRAIQVDPIFALAHYQIAFMSGARGRFRAPNVRPPTWMPPQGHPSVLCEATDAPGE